MTAEQPDLIQQIHKDYLSKDVRDYASNLEVQIKDEIQKLGCSDIETYLQKADHAEAVKIAELIKALDGIRISGEIPFDIEKFSNEYDSLLDRHHDRWNSVARTVAMEEHWFEQETAKLPKVPTSEFQENPKFLEMLLKLGKNKDLAKWYGGLVMGLVFNRSYKDMSEEVRNSAYQSVDLADWGEGMDFLGYRLSCGKLFIEGRAGDMLGAQANGGTIEVYEAGHNLGADLNGGTIIVDVAGFNVGDGSKSGEIYIVLDCSSYGENVKAAIYLMGDKVEL